jgi:hypothetical protein
MDPVVSKEAVDAVAKGAKKKVEELVKNVEENYDISLVTKWVKLLSNIFLITLPFVPLIFPLAAIGGKKQKQKSIKYKSIK